MKHSKIILPVIVFAQFCCTSLWFAGNAVLNDLIAEFHFKTGALAHITSAVQLGFISGTLSFAVFLISDRFSPSKVFFSCACLGALCNLGVLIPNNTLLSLLVFRGLTGFFLAGIYPVGMKIAADYYEKGLGKSLGFLVGALVLGTAFPHILKDFSSGYSWRSVIIGTSILAGFGGLIMYVKVPDGPYRKSSSTFEPAVIFKIFKSLPFRTAAFGYFGHMWELYTFWAFIPLLLKTYLVLHPDTPYNVPLLAFLIISIGSLGCIIGGILSKYISAKTIAFSSLTASGICCLISPLTFHLSSELFIIFLMFWGLVVVSDSPLFSTLVAQNSQPELKGSALTLVNCIGFSITILSMQFLNFMSTKISPVWLFSLLAIGPCIGIVQSLKHKING